MLAQCGCTRKKEMKVVLDLSASCNMRMWVSIKLAQEYAATSGKELIQGIRKAYQCAYQHLGTEHCKLLGSAQVHNGLR